MKKGQAKPYKHSHRRLCFVSRHDHPRRVRWEKDNSASKVFNFIAGVWKISGRIETVTISYSPQMKSILLSYSEKSCIVVVTYALADKCLNRKHCNGIKVSEIRQDHQRFYHLLFILTTVANYFFFLVGGGAGMKANISE